MGSKKKAKDVIYKVTMIVSRISIPVVLTLTLALLLRLGAAFASQNQIPEWRDSHHYHNLAKNIANGKGYIDETGSWKDEPVYSDNGKTSFWLPGYPLFLTVMMKAFGDSPRAIFIVQALLGFCLALIVFLATSFHFNRRTAFIVLLLCSISPLQVHQTTVVASEGLCAFLMVILLAVLWKWESFIYQSRKVSLCWPVLLALCLGTGVLTRSVFVPIALVAFLYLVVLTGRQAKEISFKNRYGSILLVFLATAVMVAPWLVRNQILWDEFVYQTKTGINLLIGFNDNATGGFSLEGVPMLDPEQTTEVSRDAFYKDAALNWIKNHPVKSAGLFIKKIGILYNPFPATVHGIPGLFLFCWSAALLLFAVVGLFCGRKEFSKLVFVLILLLTYTIVHGFAFSITRFRAPVEPLLAILAAYGVDSIWRYASSRPRK